MTKAEKKKFDKAASKLLKTKIEFESVITIGEIFDGIANLPLDETVLAIKMLDASCEDWGVTTELLNYFIDKHIELAEEVLLEDFVDIVDNETVQKINKLYKLINQ